MANLRNELRSRHLSLRRLHDDLRESSFARLGWNTEVRARRTLGSNDTIEHWFLAEHFLLNWSNWTGLLNRFCRYFGQDIHSFPKAWSQLIAKCDWLVFTLARDRALDEAIAKSWLDPEPTIGRQDKREGYDVSSIYTRIARNYERVEALSRAQHVQLGWSLKEKLLKQMPLRPGEFAVSRSVVLEQNDRLLDQWHDLPRRVEDQVFAHLRHYLRSTLGVSWLADPTQGVSALMSLSWRGKPVSLAFENPTELAKLDSPMSGSVAKLVDRLRVAISEIGYDAVIEDLSSPELIGGADSLLGSDDVMVIPGYLEDGARPILLAATKGWGGNAPRSFAKVMRQVKARLIEANGAVRVVIVFCDCWDSASFGEEHREELDAFARNGLRFVFFLIGVPQSRLVAIPVGFAGASQ